jgi:hypothetical protein
MSQIQVLDTVLKNTNAIQNHSSISLSQTYLFCLIYHTPIENRSLSVDLRPFSMVLMMKNIKNGVVMSLLCYRT